MLSLTSSAQPLSGRRLMSSNTLSHSLPLPRGWPRRVRSAVVQVISLAQTSLALTQGWASESMNRQLRRRAEGDSLQQEIQLIREEIRIKDARMEQLEAHRRPHYPPIQRLAILELRAARGWSLPRRSAPWADDDSSDATGHAVARAKSPAWSLPDILITSGT